MADFWAQVELILRTTGRKKVWLARETGISINTLNGWARKGRTPRIEEAVRIARALGTTVDAMSGSFAGRGEKEEGRALRELCDLLRGLSRDELVEMRGVVRSYYDLHFRKTSEKTTHRR